MKKNIQFTKEGYENLEKELAEITEQRKQAVIELRTASEMGDRSENAAYKVGRQKLSRIDSRIRHLNMLLRFGTVVEREFTGKVDIGCTVKIHDGKQERIFTIVGGYESDLTQGKISIFSPIGKSLMGKKTGEKVQIHVPAGVITYEILDVKG